jgi:hypothetical protein
MPFNLLKEYPNLLELVHFSPVQRLHSLRGVFNRDIENNPDFRFQTKQIRPIKKEGEASMDTLFGHLTTEEEKNEKGKKTGSRFFEMDRSERLHWIKPHTEETIRDEVEVFSYEDKIRGKSKIRTYIYNKTQEYVIILEPQRSQKDYYLLTAYPLNRPGGKKQIVKKLKKKLEEVY